MNIRFYNARILTMADELYYPFEGELWVEGEEISFVGKKEEIIREESVKKSWDQEIDCENNLLLPGFKNAHTHSAMTFLRSYADDLPLQEWLFNRVFPMEAKLTYEDQYDLSKLAILEYLTSGITSNFDMYLTNEAHAKSSRDMGFRTVLCGSTNDFGGTAEQEEQDYLKMNDMGSLISYRIGIHAEYTTKKELIEQFVTLTHKYKQPFYLHLAETETEVRECVERYGMSPVKFLDSIGAFEYGGGGFHGVWLDEEDRHICKEKKVGIVSNPSSNVKLASGVAKLCEMVDEGITVGLGTDGPASNNALDMFREMYLASVLQKLTKQDAAAMDANAVLRMATSGGARIMGLSDCDMLARGKKADIIMIDMKRPSMQPEHNITKNLVYSGSKDIVKMTMVNGKILYENGNFHVSTSPEEIIEKSNRIVKRIKES